MSETLIEARGVAVRFPARGETPPHQALTDVSLSLAPGELAVILGANGCGKSTFLRCVAGMLQPSDGEVRVGGRPLTGLSGRALSDARLALGMIFQSAHLVRRRSVLANVLGGTLGRHRRLAVALGRLPTAESPYAMACLHQVGLGHLARQRAGTLSGGQAQRVSVARALAQRPRVLLADEPVASLDPEAAEELMGLLRRVVDRDGIGVLCVLHQPGLAQRHADRLIGFRDGRLVFDQPSAKVAERDITHLYTKDTPITRLAA